MRSIGTPRAALAVALSISSAALWAATPTPDSAAAGPTKPTAATPGTLKPPATVPPTCANQLYFCPSSATCLPLQAVPTGQAALGPQSFDAYRCHFPPQLSSPPTRSPTSCPPGLVLTPFVPQVGPGQVAAASNVCAPASNACLPAPAAWVRQTPVMPLQLPLLGYTCRFGKSG